VHVHAYNDEHYFTRIGLWITWIGFKGCERVYGIALLLTGMLVVVWSLTLAPLGFQIFVELLLLGLINFFSNLYVTGAKQSTENAVIDNVVLIVHNEGLVVR
jgi:hypothetical protein